MTCQFHAIIENGGGETQIEATDMGRALEQAAEWAQNGSWGPETDVVGVWVTDMISGRKDVVRVEVGGK